MRKVNWIWPWTSITVFAISSMLSSYTSIVVDKTKIFKSSGIMAGQLKMWSGVNSVSEQLSNFLECFLPCLSFLIPLRCPILNLTMVLVIIRSAFILHILLFVWYSFSLSLESAIVFSKVVFSFFTLLLFLASLASLFPYSFPSIFTCEGSHWRRQVLFSFSISYKRKMNLLLMKEFPFEIAWRTTLESQKMTRLFTCYEGGRALYMSRACTIAYSSL